MSADSSQRQRSVRGGTWLRWAGGATVAVFLILVARFWHPVYGFTEFIQLDASNDTVKIAAFHEQPVYVYRDTGGYDGLYYAQIAYHPLLNDPELKPAMDNLGYRARRILPEVLAWLLAAGRPGAIVQVYSLINVDAWLVLALVAWKLLKVDSVTSWIAWAGVLFSAGAIASVRLALTDLVALTVLASAILATERGKRGWGLGLLAAAGLARETSLAALPAFWTPKGQKPNPSVFSYVTVKNVAFSVAAVAPLAAWLLYIRWRVGPGDQGWSNFTWPFSGWVEKIRASFHALNDPPDVLLAWTTFLAVAGLTVQALYVLVRPRLSEAWWRLGACYVAVFALLGTPVWEDFPGAAHRVLLPLTLAFNVLAVRRRAAIGWILAGNLAVFSGLLTLRDVPDDPRELAAARTGGVSCLVRIGDGWFGAEHTLRHRWAWSSGQAYLEFETWPHDNRKVRLDFTLRSLAQRTVVVTENGNELGKVDVGTAKTKSTIIVTLTNGRADLEISSATAGVREGPGSDARTLAFALYDPKVIPIDAPPASP